jgi:galactoside O-acetyltransferase
MKYSNINLGVDVEIDPSSSVNNVTIGDRVRVAKRVSIFGNPSFPLLVGDDCYVGMNCILNGYSAKMIIGANVSFAQNVNVMTDSGPNASPLLQRIYPLEKGEIVIGNNCWIGASSIIMPNVHLGDFCVVAAGSYVKGSFPPYSIIGGTPAKLIRMMTSEEIEKLK